MTYRCLNLCSSFSFQIIISKHYYTILEYSYVIKSNKYVRLGNTGTLEGENFHIRRTEYGSGGNFPSIPFLLKYEDTLRSCYRLQRTQIEENGLVPYLSYNTKHIHNPTSAFRLQDMITETSAYQLK